MDFQADRPTSMKDNMTRSLLALLIIAIALAPSAARAVPDEQGYVTTAPGISIYFERYGSGAQTIIIPNRLFMPEMVALARPGRTLIMYDMRNRGRSTRVEDISALTILGDVDDVEAIRKHFGRETVSLVGYSYLGLMVALYATRHPERVDRLVQMGPVPRKFGTAYPEDQRAGADTLAMEGRKAGEAWLAARDAAKAGVTDQQQLCRLQRHFFSYWLVGNPMNASRVPDICLFENEWYWNAQRHLQASFGDIQKRDFPRESFTKLSQPVLTIHGMLDRNAPYGSGLEWATTFRNGRLISVEAGAHQVWLDDPAVVHDIDTFLLGRWPTRAIGFGRE